jgi:2,4-dienoyl-CoA reductase-like NADH-dependent reductase (Old Yellow Enzyme family)/thioredoxin reductase
MNYNKLFSPLRVGSLTFKNRVVFPPIATNFASVTGEVTPELIYHYGRRAQGGAAMVTMENMCIQYPDARHGTTQPRVDDDRFIAGLSRVAYEIHKHGALAFMELTHPGMFSSLKLSGNKTPVAPSALNLRPDGVIPHELTPEEIEAIADQFAQAALRAKKAHFDGVETEAAHGLLIDQFLSPLTNKRTDEFGGSLENRVRFAKLIIDKIKQLCGQNFTVTARLGVVDFIDGGLTLEESVEIAKAYEEMGYAAVHGDVGFGSKEKRLEPMQYPEAWRGYMAKALKDGGVKIPVIAVGMIRNPERAEEILENGEADLIGLGRALIADPDWPVKAQMGRTKEIKRCIGCSECIKARHEEGTALRCGVNPNVGRLETDEILLPALQKKSILIIGAGPAGLEAAVTLKQRGHDVEIWEKEDHIGGALALGAIPPGKEKINWLIEYYAHSIEKLHIPVQLNKTATLSAVNKLKPDVVIISKGANYAPPPIKGIDKPFVKSFQDILGPKENITGKKVVVGGGGLVGCETALYLRDHGNEVTIVEMLPEIAMGMEPISRDYILHEIKKKGIVVKTSAPVQEITDEGIRIGSDGKEELLPADLFVTAFGGRHDYSLYLELKNHYETYQIGDVHKVGKIIDAVHSGFAIGKKL